MRRRAEFDLRHGTDTDGEIPVHLLGHSDEVARQAVSYEATEPAAFRHMVGELPICHRSYTFIDLGSGKGRVVILAARHPFRRIIGVEASTSLHTIASQNMRAWARAGNDTRHIRLVHADASKLEIPDDPCVIYLFNPFRERAMARLVLHLKWSLQRQPRDLWLIYYNPQFGYMLENSPFMARARVGRGFHQGDYSIWRSYGVYGPRAGTDRTGKGVRQSERA
ncbi:MAG TPA: class I SAM-dependent methyltransferase [Acidobacteriota bacterium]|nr:class I SAM-dependent methyltransferase [Acidobacteriota bacterium]